MSGVGKRSAVESPLSYQSPLEAFLSSGTPGKETLTQGVARQVHAQEKQACDASAGAGGDGCFLSAEDRRRLDDDIRINVSKAALSWTTALTNKRIDLLAKHKEGWSSLWKIGAAIALGAIPIGVDLGVEFAAEAAESVVASEIAARLVNHASTVEALLDFAGEQAAEGTKDAVNESAQDRASGEPADFLFTQLDGPGQWSVALQKRAVRELDDFGRLLLLGVTDPKVMTVGAFTKQIDALLARWQEQVGDLGDAQHQYPATLNRTVAWLASDDGSEERLALVDAWAPPIDSDSLTPEVFVKWVDEDMVPYALEMQAKRGVAPGGAGVVRLVDLANAPTDPETMAWRKSSILHESEEI